ncbi:hypothetical protein ABBQ38_007075 [Trebouxia sp. C0009 RCD-2024]
MQPSKYPIEALYYVGRQPDVLQFLIRLFFKEFLVPIFWIFKSLVQKDHRLVFQFVLKQHGISPDQIRPLTAANHQQLQAVMQQMQAAKQKEYAQHKNLSTQNPYVDWAMWLVKPPSMSSGKTEYVVKRVLTAPIRSVLPFLTVLFGAANSHTQARDALGPYLELKGIKTTEEQDVIVEKHKLMFYQFGWAALVLSCIPIIGTFFAFTNTVGAALWAIALEKEKFDLMSDEGKKFS